MNERINELVSQCIDQRWTVTGPMFDREQFAEMIVRECAKNAVLFADSTTTQGLPSKYIENYVLKHFGVEE